VQLTDDSEKLKIGRKKPEENTIQLRVTDSKQSISNQAWIYKARQRFRLQHDLFSLGYASNRVSQKTL